MMDERERLRACLAAAETLAARVEATGHTLDRLGRWSAQARRDMEAGSWRSPAIDAAQAAELELRGHVATLRAASRALLEHYRISDGPGPADFARAVLRLARVAELAADGAHGWQGALAEVTRELREAIGAAGADARRVARSGLRVAEIDARALRAAGADTLAGRVGFEARHALAELRRIATEPEQLF